jgi:ABC-type uncharacterized transport system permease subunit
MLAVGANPFVGYGGLIAGAVGTPQRAAQSLGTSIPFMLGALAVAYGFKGGLFNIGAEGQLLIGALAGAWVGTFGWVGGLPGLLAVPVVLLAGVAGGLLWGAIPGVLKARTGAHEVIVTIMLNAIAARLLEYLINNRNPVFLLDTAASTPHTRPIADSAHLPILVQGTNLHLGLLVAATLCAVVWFVLYRTAHGFELRTVGINPNAARYAGMSVPGTIILVMATSGAIAGLAGAGQVSGSAFGYLTAGDFRNIGFDSIAIALLARSNPFAVLPAAFLWGALRSGAPLMQTQAGLSIDIVNIVQALIILFVAADVIVRTVFFIRRARTTAPEVDEAVFATGWGS